jgi:hypothetical protein
VDIKMDDTMQLWIIYIIFGLGFIQWMRNLGVTSGQGDHDPHEATDTSGWGEGGE